MRIKDEQSHMSSHQDRGHHKEAARRTRPWPHHCTPGHESVHQEPSSTNAPRRLVVKRDILIGD